MSLSLRVSFLWVIYFLIVQNQRIIETEVKLSQKAIIELEKQFQRLPGLEKWFVEIPVSTV